MKIMIKSTFLVIFGFTASSTLPATVANAATKTLYSNDFESGSVAGLSGAGATSANIYASGNSTYGSFLDLASQGGAASGGTASLTLATAGYASLTLSYAIYALATVDGDGPAGGNSPGNPDAFITALSGGPTLENYSFANFPGDTQNYPGLQGPATPGEPDRTGAAAVNQFPLDGFDDAIYTFSYTFVPTGNSTTLNFTGLTNQSLGDESFGLDNILVTGVTSPVAAVPEPGTWALMLAGFGFVGAAMRRRNTAIAIAWS